MVKKYSYAPYINTEAVIKPFDSSEGLSWFTLEGNTFSYRMSGTTRVYGLGEAVRGINKRGWIYDGYCTDDPFHTEDKRSLYGAHNFLLIDGGRSGDRFGAFFDYPARITFDVGFSDPDLLTVTPQSLHLDVYIIEGETLRDIVKEFRSIIGKSYVPPFWAFGFGQSRWSYFNKDAVLRIADEYQKAGIPLDMIYLDIDYLDDFMDFTVNAERFPAFENFVAQMKERGIHLIPIIDAAIKQKAGYRVFEEGREKGFFCKDENGEDYIVGVWPGMSALPDFLNEEASEWFGAQYRFLTEMGIDGFWNDMNEPALFYSEKGLKRAFEEIRQFEDVSLNANTFFAARDVFASLSNSQKDYDSFFHRTASGIFRHNDVHNLYGYRMTRSAAKAMELLRPDKKTLLFSRASAVGAHRYGGIWTGDNHSWWSHILQSLQQMPGLNMCGFLYTGSDIGGFNGNCTRDLLLRWLAFAIFTPLMRDHSACGTRDQEAFAFGDSEDFRHIIRLRYRLLPYLYRSFLDAAENDEMFFRPLCFDFEDDERARTVEDQLMVGESLMIAPVYTQNANGRYVYLPEDMRMVRMHSGKISTEKLNQGDHYLSVPLSDVVFFIRKGRLLPLAEAANNTAQLDMETVQYI